MEEKKIINEFELNDDDLNSVNGGAFVPGLSSQIGKTGVFNGQGVRGNVVVYSGEDSCNNPSCMYGKGGGMAHSGIYAQIQLTEAEGGFLSGVYCKGCFKDLFPSMYSMYFTE